MSILLLADFIVDRQHEERVAYTRPVELVGDEYVEVYCGDRVNFLVHNYPNQTKMSQRRSSERLGMVLCSNQI